MAIICRKTWWQRQLLLLLILNLSLAWNIPLAKASSSLTLSEISETQTRFFPETGKTVSSMFLKFWEANGGQAQFGLPLTDELQEVDPASQKLNIVQWFEFARLEYQPAYRGTVYEVQPALLGQEVLDKGLVTPLPASFAPVEVFELADSNLDLKFFSETKHTLRGVFLQYWNTYGGLSSFGYPLSEQYAELNLLTGKRQLVQWFERAKFEFYPEFAGTRYEVRLANLGWQLFHYKYWPAHAPVAVSQNADLPASSLPAKSSSNFGYGMNAWLFGQDYAHVFSLVEEAGFSWIRQQLGWNYLEPAPGQYNWTELDKIVASASQHKVQLLFSVVRSPDWVGANGGFPSDPTQFASFLSKLATRYASTKDTLGRKTILGFEIWNEPNLGTETGGLVSAASYVKLLRAAYPAVKAADHEVLVLFAGLSPTGVNEERVAVDDLEFLRQCYAYNGGEVQNYFDVLGAHTGGAGNAPDEFWPDNAPTNIERGWTTHASFYFRRVEQLRKVMVEHGNAAKKIWLTEFGWTTANPAPGYEYGQLVSEEDQANYLVGAFSRAHREYADWLTGMFVWNLNFASVVEPTDEKAPWSILKSDLSPRKSYEALKNMSKP